MSDLHKSAGIWGLGFHILIATTGAWMGLAPLFEQGYKFITTPAAMAPSQPVRKAEGSEPAPMQSLDAMYATAQQAVPGLEARYVSLRRWGSGTAEAGFTGNLSGHLASTARVDIHAVTGVPKKVHDPRTAGFWSLVNSLMEPLHFGDFGGLALKWLYFFLGMTPAFLSISGTLIWLDARQQRRREADAAHPASAGNAIAAG